MRSQERSKRGAAALAVAIATLVFTASGAGAAAPAPLSGEADAKALSIRLTVPAVDELKRTLADAGLPVAGLPNTGLGAINLEQIISWSNAVSKNGKAAGIAAPLAGLITASKVEVKCESATCNDKKSTAALRQELPAGIGLVEIAGAKGAATSPRDVTADAAMVRVNLGLSHLLKDGALKPVGDLLWQLTDTVNKQVLEPVNDTIGTLEGLLDGSMPDAVKDALEPYIEVGRVKNLPDLREVDLFNATVLGGRADVTRAADQTLTAFGESKVTDVRVMGDWLTIDSIVSQAKSYIDLNLQQKASSLIDTTPGAVKKSAQDALRKVNVDATRSMKLTGADLGGLLKLTTPELLLLNDEGFNRIVKALRDNAPDGTEAVVEDVISALDILYRTAGIELEVVKGFVSKPKSASASGSKQTVGNTTTEQGEAQLDLAAAAQSDYLRLTVAPKIPLVTQGVTPAGSLVPRLGPDDYLATGLKLQVEFPRASSSVAQGAKVLGVNLSRTGVATPWIVALVMLGAAIGVRRFSLSR